MWVVRIRRLFEYKETDLVLIFDELYKTMARRWYEVGRVYLSSFQVELKHLMSVLQDLLTWRMSYSQSQ